MKLLAIFVSLAFTTSAFSVATPVASSTGFVKTSGTKFVLNGATYSLVGYATTPGVFKK
jgi:hypothetical protein